MKRYVHRAAFAALLAAPVLAIPAWTASAAPAKPAAAAACPPAGTPGGTGPADRVEGLIGNLSPAPSSTVAVGATISFLIADEDPFPPATAGGGPIPVHVPGDVLVSVDGHSVIATAGPKESGVPISYANPSDKGSRSTACEVPFSFALPTDISGTAHVRVTARDGDGNVETVNWTLTVQTTALPDGAVGGIGLAAIAGLALMVVQVRRRRGATAR